MTFIRFLSAVILLIGSSPAMAKPVARMSGWVIFTCYEPTRVHEFEQLPRTIREKATAHLTDRLGPEFAGRLSYFLAQVVDEEELTEQCPELIVGERRIATSGNSETDNQYVSWVNDGLKEQDLRIHAFDLHYVFSWPEKGIGSYVASIKMDRKGRILWPLDLPAINDHPEKADIISLDEAKKIAGENGFIMDGTMVAFDYDPQTDSFIWRFLRSTERRKTFTKYDRIVISAESGKVVKKDSFVAYST